MSRLTGLSPHVIRVWEKRYGAVVPARTGTNRRLYSDEEVDRLQLLARATEAGHKIGIISKLAVADLRRLVAATAPGVLHDGPAEGLVSGAGGNGGGKKAVVSGEKGEEGRRDRKERRSGDLVGNVEIAGNSSEQLDAKWVAEALEATRSFRLDSLQGVLDRGAVRLGHNGVLHRLISPLAQEIGELWQRGEVTAAHEHFASAVIREFLLRGARPYAQEEGAPRAIVTTPAGQLHELGAVMVAAAAANLGWRPIYLGPSLPPAEIAGAALQNGAQAVLLSIVYPADDPWLPRDLLQLRKLLPSSVDIVAGGRAARSYTTVLREIRAIVPDGLEELCDLLEEMRGTAASEDAAATGDKV